MDGELPQYRQREEIRARVDKIVENPETAQALKAWYGLLCKRPTFHDEYLQTFNRPNVTVVDTQGRGVERFTKKGLIANGHEYELDCIIFATGFDTASGLMAGLAFDPRGVGGVTLSERWAKDLSTLHGLQVSDFPNMFVIGGPQGAFATTVTYCFAVETEHCAKIVAHCRNHGIDRVEARREAEQTWQAQLAEKAVDQTEYLNSCTPGYINLEGKGGNVWQFVYGAGPVQYRRVVASWFENRLNDDLDLGMQCHE